MKTLYPITFALLINVAQGEVVIRPGYPVVATSPVIGTITTGSSLGVSGAVSTDRRYVGVSIGISTVHLEGMDRIAYSQGILNRTVGAQTLQGNLFDIGRKLGNAAQTNVVFSKTLGCDPKTSYTIDLPAETLQQAIKQVMAKAQPSEVTMEVSDNVVIVKPKTKSP